MLRYVCGVTAALFALAFQSFTAAAAPQILGLMATNIPQPLYCEGGTCQAILTSYCLQPDRLNPHAGHPYQPAGHRGLEIVATSADGSVMRLPVGQDFVFEANEPVASVAVMVDRSFLDERGIRALAIEITEGATLLPVAKQGDPNPLKPEEIAKVVGPDRKLAMSFFEDGPIWSQARLLSALMSPLPDQRIASANFRQGLWRSAISPALEHSVSPQEVKRAREVLGICNQSVERGVTFNLRTCLGDSHRSLIWKRNEKLWKALKPMF